MVERHGVAEISTRRQSEGVRQSVGESRDRARETEKWRERETEEDVG